MFRCQANLTATFMLRCVLTLLLISPLISHQFVLAQENQNHTDKQIEILISHLDSNSFDERQNATTALTQLGPHAVEQLFEMLPYMSNEGRIRGLYVLRSFAISDESTLEQLAEQKLRLLGLSEDQSLAKKANSATNRMLIAREEIALNLFRRLGATIGRSSLRFRNKMLPTRDLISFDEQWKGNPGDLSKLRWLQRFKQIEFIGEQFDDQLAPYLMTMPGLHEVVFKNCKVTDKTANLLHRIDQLTTISFYYCPITDRCVNQLSRIQSALKFRFVGTKLTRSVAESLAGKDQLITVDYRQGALLGVASVRNCIVTRIESNSAAARAGIKPNDEITKFNGEPVNEFSELTKKISFFAPGDRVKIEWRHNGDLHSATIKLGQW